MSRTVPGRIAQDLCESGLADRARCRDRRGDGHCHRICSFATSQEYDATRCRHTSPIALALSGHAQRRRAWLTVPAATLDEFPTAVAKSCDSNTTREDSMRNGGSDCCGTCSFNRSLKGQCPKCELKQRHFEPLRDPRSGHRGPVLYLMRRSPEPRTKPTPHPNRNRYTFSAPATPSAETGREVWQPSPDPEEIRHHFLDIVRLPQEHADGSYHFHTRPANVEALMRLLECRDARLVPALGDIDQRAKAEHVRSDIEESIRLARERLESDPR